MRHQGLFRYQDVHWSGKAATFCGADHCLAPAEVLWEKPGTPYCLEHADEQLERLVLLAAAPWARTALDPVGAE